MGKSRSVFRASESLVFLLLGVFAAFSACSRSRVDEGRALSSPSGSAGGVGTNFMASIASLPTSGQPAGPVVNLASFTTAVAPGSLAAFFGTGIVTVTDSPPPGQPLPTSLDGVAVIVGGQFAKLAMVSPTQVNFLVPSFSPGNASVTVTVNGSAIYSGTLKLTSIGPGIFTASTTGFGFAKAQAFDKGAYDAIFTAAADPNNPSGPPIVSPVAVKPVAGSGANYLILYGTGWRGRSSLANVKVSFDGVLVSPAYAGIQGDGGADSFPGLDQINVAIPASYAQAPAQIANLQVVADGQASNWVRVCMAGTGGACPVPTPASLVNVSGTGQAQAMNWVFGQPMLAQVRDRLGAPIANLPVTYTASADLSVRVNNPTVLTDAWGSASNQAVGQQTSNNNRLGDGPGIVTLTVGNLSTQYFMTTVPLLFGAAPPGVQGYITLPTSVALTIPAGTTCTMANLATCGIQAGIFETSGPSGGGALPNAGMYLITPPNDAGVTATCANGIDQVGTVLTDSTGTATCLLAVGSAKGEVSLTVRLFGGNDHTLLLTVN